MISLGRFPIPDRAPWWPVGLAGLYRQLLEGEGELS